MEGSNRKDASTSRSAKLELSYLLNNSNQPVTPTPIDSQSVTVPLPPRWGGSQRRANAGGVPLRRHRCDCCPAAFSQSHDLLKHKRTVHEKLRPFKCEVCGKSFGEKGNLSKHKKSVHLNERPFKCSICHSSFAFKDGLQRHMSLVHYDMRPFKCKNCGADFKQVSQLRKHACPSASSFNSATR